MKRVVVIGDTKHGGFGHSLDEAFTGVEGTRLVALSDPDEAGRAASIKRCGAEKGYADYRKMLADEKPDIVVVATHDLGNHPEFIRAAVAAGAHVYVEKPLATTPAEIDSLIATCDAAGKLLIVAIPWRAHPPIHETVIPSIRAGKIGEPRYARMYGFGGELAGDQWFIDLYPHFFDLLTLLFGMPSWCHAHITQDGRDATPGDMKPGAFGMGPSAGNGIRVYYQYDCGFAAEFQSFRDDGKESPYRMDIFGTAGAMSVTGAMRDGWDVLLHPLSNPAPMDDRWQVIAETTGRKWIDSHHRMAKSMVAMIDGLKPEYTLCTGRDQRNYAMMSMAARMSHVKGCRIPLPMEFDGNPFESWK